MTSIDHEVILQIIPADAWYAVYAYPDNPEHYIDVDRIAFWGLVETDQGFDDDDLRSYRTVRGFQHGGYMASVEGCDNFLGYIHEDILDVDPDNVYRRFQELYDDYVERLEAADD